MPEGPTSSIVAWGIVLEADAFAVPGNYGPADSEPYYPFIQAETFKALPSEKFDYRRYRLKAAPLTGILDDGDVLDLGDRVFQVFHLPGHSPGSIALYEAKTQILLSGDVVYNGDLIDNVSHSDPKAYRTSLKQRIKGSTDIRRACRTFWLLWAT